VPVKGALTLRQAASRLGELPTSSINVRPTLNKSGVTISAAGSKLISGLPPLSDTSPAADIAVAFA
jgi:hypothetical protein